MATCFTLLLISLQADVYLMFMWTRDYFKWLEITDITATFFDVCLTLIEFYTIKKILELLSKFITMGLYNKKNLAFIK